uniref:Integrase catalytic domain-containing protein n=1 Tax=Solanum lycopersicum TaxID=4081 RepID=A0A3Q7G9E8_SOLLC
MVSVSYYNQFITVWNQLYGSIDPTCGCICHVAAKMLLRFEEEKTQAFLLGLDDAQFGATRSQIFGTRPLHVLNEAYYLVSQEESTSRLCVTVMIEPMGWHSRLKLNPHHPRNTSAPIAGKLVTLLNGRGGRGGGRGGRGGRDPPGREQSAGRGGDTAAHADGPMPVPAAAFGNSQSGVLPGLSTEQMTRLLTMLDTPAQSGNNTGTVHALSPDWLIDSGVSHHMTGNFPSLYDIMSVPKCAIGLLDGTRVMANYCGSDRVLTTEIGRGTARNGVYVFQSQAFVSASRVDLVELLHKRLGHPSPAILCSPPFNKSLSDIKQLESVLTPPFYHGVGALVETSCVGTPQQNGLVERKHRRILNVARSLMFQASLPVEFWWECVRTAVYLINRTPSRLLSGKRFFLLRLLLPTPPSTSYTPPVQHADFPVVVSTPSPNPAAVPTTQPNTIAVKQPEPTSATEPTATVSPVDPGVVPPPAWASGCVRHPPGYLSKYVCQSATSVPPITSPSTALRSGSYALHFSTWRRLLGYLNLCRRHLSHSLRIWDLKYFLGIECARSSTGLVLCQRKYALEILQEAGLTDCKPVVTPLPPGHGLATSTSVPIHDPGKYRRLVGRLIYMTITRPDLAYSVHLLSQFMHEPKVDHLNAAMRVLRYLKGHPGQGILLRADSNLQILAYCDSDWATCPLSRKSVSGYFIMLGGSPISWKTGNRLQSLVLPQKLSTGPWLTLVTKFGGFSISSDVSESRLLHFRANPVFHELMKHVDIDCHIVRECVRRHELSTHYVPTRLQRADLFTKPLSHPSFSFLLSKLGIHDVHAPT